MKYKNFFKFDFVMSLCLIISSFYLHNIFILPIGIAYGILAFIDIKRINGIEGVFSSEI